MVGYEVSETMLTPWLASGGSSEISMQSLAGPQPRNDKPLSQELLQKSRTCSMGCEKVPRMSLKRVANEVSILFNTLGNGSGDRFQDLPYLHREGSEHLAAGSIEGPQTALSDNLSAHLISACSTLCKLSLICASDPIVFGFAINHLAEPSREVFACCVSGNAPAGAVPLRMNFNMLDVDEDPGPAQPYKGMVLRLAKHAHSGTSFELPFARDVDTGHVNHKTLEDLCRLLATGTPEVRTIRGRRLVAAPMGRVSFLADGFDDALSFVADTEPGTGSSGPRSARPREADVDRSSVPRERTWRAEAA